MADEPVVQLLNQGVAKNGRWGFKLSFDWTRNIMAIHGIASGCGVYIKRWA